MVCSRNGYKFQHPMPGRTYPATGPCRTQMPVEARLCQHLFIRADQLAPPLEATERKTYDHAVVIHSKLEYIVGLTHTNSIESFPAGAHDDAVDSTTQALNLSAGAYGVSGIIMPGSP